MRVAVIGIGSNSVRMLVADIDGSSGRRLVRDREATRLFAGLDEKRNLSRESMDKTVNAVAAMARRARRMGAETLRLFATSATRDAANSDELAALIRERAQVELEITPGEEEAALSYIGATNGGPSGVIDIGGGSTEVVTGDGLDVHCAFSCQMGAVRLFRALPIASAADLPAVQAEAARILEENLARQRDFRPPETWIGTGGTFTALAAMVRGIVLPMRNGIHGTVVTMEAAAKLAEALAGLTVQERLAQYGLQPGRADIVVHGICILLACMRRFGIAQITVSEYGNLDGYIKRTWQLTGGLHNAGESV